jgi:hypothetical protein
MGVPIGIASGLGAGVGFSLHETQQRASRVRIKIALHERMRVSSGFK